MVWRSGSATTSFAQWWAQSTAVSEETIRQLAGHVNPRMLSRYAHIRASARRAAIATLELDINDSMIASDPPQKSPQSAIDVVTAADPAGEKSLKNKGSVLGSPGRIRTSALTVKSRPLYRLTYRGPFGTLFTIDLATRNQKSRT